MRWGWGRLCAGSRKLEDTINITTVVVSDGFHLLRATSIARRLGLTAYGSPAANSPIKPYSRLEWEAVFSEVMLLSGFWLRTASQVTAM